MDSEGVMTRADTPYPFIGSTRTKEIVFLKHFIHNPNIIVGDYTYYNDPHRPENFEVDNVRGCYFSKLIIGKFCQIAYKTTFITDDMNHKMDGFSTYPFHIFDAWKEDANPKKDCRDTVVGNDVLITTNSVILPGVTIGDGAVIGAYAVVTKDVEPYTIVAGNPARVIRKRFSDEVIKDLIEIEWWDWDYEKITRNVQNIVSADIEKLRNAK